VNEAREPFTDDVAAYDAWYHTPWGAYAEEREWELVEALAQPHSGERALDVGCGTGRLVARLAAAGLETVGLEPDEGMRDAAATRLRRTRADTAHVVGGIAESLPFADRTFDLVTAVTVLEFVRDEAAALREMARVARGRIFVGGLNARSAYGQRILRGEAGETLSRARLHGPRELASLVKASTGAKAVEWRTTLLELPTDSPEELAEQACRDAGAVESGSDLGGFIAIIAEV